MLHISFLISISHIDVFKSHKLTCVSSQFSAVHKKPAASEAFSDIVYQVKFDLDFIFI